MRSSSLPQELNATSLPENVNVKDMIRIRFNDKTGECECESEDHKELFETKIKPMLVVPKDQVPQYLPNRMSDEEMKQHKKKWEHEQENKKKEEEKKHDKKEQHHEDNEHDKNQPEISRDGVASASTSTQDLAVTSTDQTVTALSAVTFTTSSTTSPSPGSYVLPDYYQENSGKRWQLYDVWYTGFKLQNTATGDNRTATAAWEWDSIKGKYVIYFKFFDPTGNTLQSMLRGLSDNMFNVQLDNGDYFAGGYNP